MNSMNLVAPIIQRAASANPKEDGDYYDSEGFLVCGRCGTRRETLVDLSGGELPPRKVRCLCACRANAYEEDEKKRRADAAIAKLRSNSLMDIKLRASTFDAAIYDQYNTKNLSACKRYAEHFGEMREQCQGILLYGGVGTGKTYAAACIANYLLSLRIPVVMTSFVKLIGSMQSFSSDDERIIRQINRADLVIIDDLGVERSSDFVIEKVYNVIDSRSRANLPMILTTNLSLDMMKNAADVRYQRIYDRIFETCFPMLFTGPSRRMASASSRFKKMKSFLEGENDKSHEHSTTQLQHSGTQKEDRRPDMRETVHRQGG